MTDKEAMKLALGALEYHASQTRPIYQTDIAITALKERLSDPMREVQRLGQEIEQEPICPACKAEVLYECVACSSNNYPPPQRTWVGLTNREQLDIFAQSVAKKRSDYEHYKAIEQALKEKNQ